ncbi:MAG: lytic transglycosylase domain-containing protein [Lachnospiraceae bacterium]|nr:lytic transglycosylase domain-containing protein [Lachnospiraceae bacterium]
MYIEGLGYVDENTYNVYNVANTTKASSSASTEAVVQSAFDQILEQEKANLVEDQKKTVDLESIFTEASQKYNVSIDLLKAVAKAESNFNPEATSHCGAMGIMQLMPSTAKSLGVNNAYDPYENIMGGAKLLNQLDKMYNGNIKLMLAGYNAGPGNVAKYDGVPPFTETQNYVAKVLEYLNQGVNIDGTTVTINSGTQSLDTTQSITDAAKLEQAFSYSEYDILMKYYETMLETIAKIGDTEETASNNNQDDSLEDLFRLSNIQYSRNNIDLI